MGHPIYIHIIYVFCLIRVIYVPHGWTTLAIAIRDSKPSFETAITIAMEEAYLSLTNQLLHRL